MGGCRKKQVRAGLKPALTQLRQNSLFAEGSWSNLPFFFGMPTVHLLVNRLTVTIEPEHHPGIQGQQYQDDAVIAFLGLGPLWSSASPGHNNFSHSP